MTFFYDSIARYYDPENEALVEDLALFSDLVEEITGTILDVGCGTGRVMFHLAGEGHSVHGIDRSKEMLVRARRKMEPRPDLRERCTLIEGDILRDMLPASYAAIIIPYNTFMHLHGEGEQLAALKKLKGQLEKQGCLIIDIPNAGEHFAAQDDNAVNFERSFTEPETGHRVMQQSVSWIDRTAQIQHITWIYDEIGEDGLLRRTVEPQTLRHVFAHEMDLMLHISGLRCTQRFGDYDGSTFEGDCPRMITVATHG